MKKKLKLNIIKILEELHYPLVDINVQTPKQLEHGDLTTNVAMILANRLKKNPQEIAKEIIKKLNLINEYKKIEIAGPGFINIKINKENLLKILKKIPKSNLNYGKNEFGKGKNALVEFVSANPTGPLTVGHGRGAIIGDIVSRILEWNGYSVEREYYFNNAGRQMRKLGESLRARYLELFNQKVDFPEDGYQGQYIIDIANDFKKEYKKEYINENKIEIFKNYAENKIFSDIKETLKSLNIIFNNFFNEDDLYKNNAISDIIEDLREKKLIYNKDNAIWFKGTKVNRPVDRVLIKSSGEPTYRLPDMAYHRTKFERGYDKIVDVFGADHMDAYPDVIEAMNQLDYDINKINILIHQFVTITKNNKPIKMSTRKANFVTLEELCQEVGSDVVRYFFVMRNMNTHLNFELDLAKDNSDANPIFYLQYAHARICTILNRAKTENFSFENTEDLTLLNNELENELILKMVNFPETVKSSYIKLDPQIISNYLEDLAARVHKYYSKSKIITDDLNLTNSRLYLVNTIRIVLRNGLNILGIKAKERM